MGVRENARVCVCAGVCVCVRVCVCVSSLIFFMSDACSACAAFTSMYLLRARKNAASITDKGGAGEASQTVRVCRRSLTAYEPRLALYDW